MTEAPMVAPAVPNIPVAPPPPLPGLGIAAVVVAAIAGWIFLGTSALSDTSLFGGLLILWYWATVEKLEVQRLPRTVIGALVGIGLAWGMLYGGTQFGPAGLAVALLVLVIAIYLDIIAAAPLFVNGATMLFSIVAAAPLIQLQVNWIELCLATIGGALYFGAFLALIRWAARKLST